MNKKLLTLGYITAGAIPLIAVISCSEPQHYYKNSDPHFDFEHANRKKTKEFVARFKAAYGITLPVLKITGSQHLPNDWFKHDIDFTVTLSSSITFKNITLPANIPIVMRATDLTPVKGVSINSWAVHGFKILVENKVVFYEDWSTQAHISSYKYRLGLQYTMGAVREI